jgi:polyphosphate kinase
MKNLYQIREISILSFNERVLQEAEDERNPLLERLRFLGIFSSNMDEFFKVRVASIQRRIELGKKRMADVLEIVGEESRELDERFQAAYANIRKSLDDEGIRLVAEQDVDRMKREIRDWVREYFQDKVLPALVPIILGDSQPFPQLTDGALYFGVKMWSETPRYAILDIPSALPRFVELPNGNIMYLDDVIRYALDEVFYIFNYDRIKAFEFKISRDAELDIDNDFSEGYVRKMEKVLQQRKGGRPTRLVYDAAMPPGLLQMLIKGCRISKDDTLIGGGRYHNMKDLMRFPARRPELLFEKREPAKHPVLYANRTPMLDIIAKQDLLLTYPYQSFDYVIRLLREAAIDPDVNEISITLYRAARPSQVVNALINAARNGKRVFVQIELQARFDEENNIDIAELLQEAGASVTFGFPPIKVHSKLLYIRKGKKRFAGFSTGNFNEVTGKLYVDSILLTANKAMTSEVARLFKLFESGQSLDNLRTPRLKELLISPFNSRRALMKLIQREKGKGKDGYIFLKVNHLTDARLVKRIREAAKAGTPVDLVVRTTYAVPPHENIRAISILDRYLEHQRVYIFGSGEDRLIYMASADLMERNLDWRVEAGFPVHDRDLCQQVVDMMTMQLSDTSKARILDEMQTNRYVGDGGPHQQAQHKTWRYLQRRYQKTQQAKKETPPAAQE